MTIELRRFRVPRATPLATRRVLQRLQITGDVGIHDHVTNDELIGTFDDVNKEFTTLSGNRMKPGTVWVTGRGITYVEDKNFIVNADDHTKVTFTIAPNPRMEGELSASYERE